MGKRYAAAAAELVELASPVLERLTGVMADCRPDLESICQILMHERGALVRPPAGARAGRDGRASRPSSRRPEAAHDRHGHERRITRRRGCDMARASTSFNFGANKAKKGKKTAAKKGKPRTGQRLATVRRRREEEVTRWPASASAPSRSAVPPPRTTTTTARGCRRRTASSWPPGAAGVAEAKAVLAHLPGPGESLHAVCTARMDLTDVIGRCWRRRAGATGC